MVRPARVCLAALAAALAAACGRPEPARTDPERTILEAERLALIGLLAEASDTALVPFDDVLVAVRAELIHDLLRAAVPFEHVVDERYLVRVDDATVRFRSGLALVELDGRAGLVGQPDIFVQVTLFGVLEVLGIDPGRANLTARVEILGLDTRVVGAGPLSAPAQQIARELGRRKAAEFNDVLGDVRIPVRLDEALHVPAIEADELSIPGATLPLGIELGAVRVVDDWILVSLRVEIAPQRRT